MVYPTALLEIRFVLCHTTSCRRSQEKCAPPLCHGAGPPSHIIAPSAAPSTLVSGLWEQPNSWGLPATCVRVLGARRRKRHTKKATLQQYVVEGNLKCSQRSCLVSLRGAAFRLSTTPPRLWPAGPLTVTLQRTGRKKGTVSDVLRRTGCGPSHQPHGTMRGFSPRSPRGPGALANFKKSQ